MNLFSIFGIGRHVVQGDFILNGESLSKKIDNRAIFEKTSRYIVHKNRTFTATLQVTRIRR